MHQESSDDAIKDFLLETVGAPCVRQLRGRHGADAVGEVLRGQESAVVRDQLEWWPEERPDLECVRGRVRLVQEDTAVELPLGEASMSFDDVVERVDTFFDCIDDWYCETRTGWGQQVEIEWPAGFTRAGWQRALSRGRGGPDGNLRGREHPWRTQSPGWVPAWNDARSAFVENQRRLSDLIGRQVEAMWMPIDRDGRLVYDPPRIPDLPAQAGPNDGPNDPDRPVLRGDQPV